MVPVHNSSAAARKILPWYDRNARVLPWRVPPARSSKGERPDPYRVWLSEVMLQQTTVATVKERYQRFLDLWPVLADLAAAPQEAVLAEWAGLGYYARARNLHKCAELVMSDHDGLFPETAAALQKLPGIGPYTAAAIASIAFGEPAPVMDGNIERVMARLFNVRTPLPDAKPVLYDHAAALTPKKRPGDYAQGLMDLGATICIPRNPACALCPLREMCLACHAGTATDLPLKKKKQAKPVRYGTVFVIRRKPDGAALLIRRPAKGLLGGMIAFPTTDWTDAAGAAVTPPVKADWAEDRGQVRHTFTHFHLELTVWEAILPAAQAAKLEGEWHKDPATAGLPTVFRKALEAVRY